MDYKDKIVDFLSKPDNIRLALEIAEHIEDVKTELVVRFWTKALSELQTMLNGKTGWKAGANESFEFTDAWGGLSILPSDRQNCYVYPRAEQDRGGGVYFGIWKNKMPAEVISSDAFAALDAKLRTGRYKGPTQPSAGYKNFPFHLRSVDTVEQIAKGDFSRPATVAESLFDLLEEVKGQLEAVNNLRP